MSFRLYGSYSLSLFIVLSISSLSFSATNNSGNAPCFLWVDLATNGLGSLENNQLQSRMSPETIDIGVDLGADGTVDYWASNDESLWLAEGTGTNSGASSSSKSIQPNAWRRFIIRLDEYAGQTATIQIVDRSTEAYIAVNSIRMNFADGTVVANEVPNGDFESAAPLDQWTIVEGSINSAAQLIVDDPDGTYTYYENRFFSSDVNGNQDTVVIESQPFVLQELSSFVHGMVDGGGSELWNKPGAGGSDNGSGLYLDIGTETSAPDGEYTPGVDIPLLGHISQNNYLSIFLFNTSGLEGKQAQVVALDQSETHYLVLDGFRMNYEPDHIVNGGFEDVPVEWLVSPIEYTDHPSGGIPGWNVSHMDGGDASVFFFDGVGDNDGVKTGYVYVGTAGPGGVSSTGVELRSDVFEIIPVPNKNENVFMQFSANGGATKIETPDFNRGLVWLSVDANDNSSFFEEETDSNYYLQNHGWSWNNERGGNHCDQWGYPDYRFYIDPSDQGKQAKIMIEDTIAGSWGWVAVDDFYFWNGSEAALAFPNSDFEQGANADGTIPDWDDQPAVSMRTWLSGSVRAFNDGLALHRTMGRTNTMVDGEFAADSSDHGNDGGPGGDNGQGFLESVAFTVPELVETSDTSDWFLYE